MAYQGTIISANSHIALIMTENGSVMRVNGETGYKIGQRICFSDRELISIPNPAKSVWLTYRRIQSVLVVASLLISLGVYSVFNLMPYHSSSPVVAQVTVKINPAVRLAVNEDGLVSHFTALNDDAKALDLNSLVGMTLENAISSFTQMTTKAGFIDPADGRADLVTVTFEPESENLSVVKSLQVKLNRAAWADNALQAVSMDVIDDGSAIIPADFTPAPVNAQTLAVNQAIGKKQSRDEVISQNPSNDYTQTITDTPEQAASSPVSSANLAAQDNPGQPKAAKDQPQEDNKKPQVTVTVIEATGTPAGESTPSANPSSPVVTENSAPGNSDSAPGQNKPADTAEPSQNSNDKDSSSSAPGQSKK